MKRPVSEDRDQLGLIDEPDSVQDQLARLRHKAIELLARREHSYKELATKLILREFARDEIHGVLDQLVEQNLLSDARFAEHYVRHRSGAGFGPHRIEAELKERGVADHLIAEHLSYADETWQASALQQRIKKFGTVQPEDLKARLKIEKFLHDRGFTRELSRRSVDQYEDE